MSALLNIFETLLDPKQGDLSPELAQHVLGIEFTDEQVKRYETLAYRHQDGALSPKEYAELDAYITANTFLTVLKSKARRSLLHRSPAA